MKKIYDIIKKLYYLFRPMEHYIPENEVNLHNQIVQASFNTYLPLTSQGFQVTPNPLAKNKTSVGGLNKVYPDIVVWRPNQGAVNKGTAVVSEVIETPGSVNYNRELWRKLGSINSMEFTLIVPSEQATNVKNIIQTENIGVKRLQTYIPNSNGTVSFYDIPLE